MPSLRDIRIPADPQDLLAGQRTSPLPPREVHVSPSPSIAGNARLVSILDHAEPAGRRSVVAYRIYWLTEGLATSSRASRAMIVSAGRLLGEVRADGRGGETVFADSTTGTARGGYVVTSVNASGDESYPTPIRRIA